MLQQQETWVFNGENVLNFFSEDSHNTQRTHFWCVSGRIYAIQLSNKDYEVLSIGFNSLGLIFNNACTVFPHIVAAATILF